jgi:phosphoglycerol transferase MdoB-like AlkP superfamily enzyme
LLVYAPKIIEPRTIDVLASQIDLAPTLFSLLGWSYDSEFFGKDLLRLRRDEGRALIGTYQHLGLLNASNQLTVLKPGRQAEAYAFNPESLAQEPIEMAATSLDDVVTYYQRAADLYATRVRHGKL